MPESVYTVTQGDLREPAAGQQTFGHGAHDAPGSLRFGVVQPRRPGNVLPSPGAHKLEAEGIHWLVGPRWWLGRRSPPQGGSHADGATVDTAQTIESQSPMSDTSDVQQKIW